MLTSFYKDIFIFPSLIIIVNEIFLFQTEYSFDISLIKNTFVVNNEYRYYLFEAIGGNWGIDAKSYQ